MQQKLQRRYGQIFKRPCQNSRRSAEEGKIARAKAEMEKLGFDKIDIDPQGNLLGYMGSGEN